MSTNLQTRLNVDQLCERIASVLRTIEDVLAGRMAPAGYLTVDEDLANQRQALDTYTDLLHEYALKINPRGVISIAITGSVHGWGTRIVKPCRMVDDYICGVTGTKTCTTDPKKQATCPSC